MKAITIYDSDSDRIEKISDKYGLTTAEIIEMILDYIEEEETDIF